MSVFSNRIVPSVDLSIIDSNQAEEVHLTELSKIIFPQSINTEEHNVSVVHVVSLMNTGIDKAIVTAQSLSESLFQKISIYLKKSKSLVLQFRAEDMIYPFHYFW